MRYEQTISINKNVADMINKYLYVEPEPEGNHHGLS